MLIMTILQETLPRQIKHYRKLRRLTQDDLSAYLDVSKSTIVMWENGSRTPTLEKIFLLCKVLKCTTDDLFDLTGDDIQISDYDYIQKIYIDEKEDELKNILENYYSLDDYGRDYILEVLKHETYRCHQLNTLRNKHDIFLDVKLELKDSNKLF